MEAMVRDEQSIPPRAMILNRKYRTLVSSWIEPLNEEAELGFEIDYIARYTLVVEIMRGFIKCGKFVNCVFFFVLQPGTFLLF